MLIVNTFAASVSEERRRLHNMVCNRNGDCGRQKRGAEERQYLTPMQYGGAEEERRGQTEEMQRSWHPTGKVLGNVVGGIVGKLRGGENLMQNGPGGEGEEERRCFPGWDPKTTGCDPANMRRGGNENLMQNGPGGGEEERRGNNNEVAYDCPTEFEKIEGIEHKCFYFHTDPNGTMDTPTFAQAVQICKGKKSTIFDPDSLEEGKIVQRVVQKRPHKYFTVWLNYQDIDMKASLIQDETVLMDSKYMGSLSTFTKIPDNWWAPTGKEYSDHLTGYHCAVWTCSKYPTMCAITGVYKSMCDTGNALVCEVDGSSSLRQYVTDFNYDKERRGENMMQNRRLINADGLTKEMQDGQEKRQWILHHYNNGQEKRQGENMMQNGPGGGEEERRCLEGTPLDECPPGDTNMRRGGNENMMQNGPGGEAEEERRKMCMQGPDGKPDEHLCQ